MSLQRGMNFRSRGRPNIILMSTRRGAPYRDRLEDEGRVLIYEGHDVPRNLARKSPKTIDQPMVSPTGKMTQNGKFFEGARRAKAGEPPELVRVYEKVKNGIWTFNGVFALTDAWVESDGRRQVFKFQLEIQDIANVADDNRTQKELEHSRLIPSAVKLEVWKRDRGCCCLCGSSDNLHFDHELPFSKGGTSLSTKNIRLPCRRHNLEKRDRIE
ncbi:MAG: HNH endonuclease [Thermoanaerobaculia bacterium]